jgi:hypothetical protein
MLGVSFAVLLSILVAIWRENEDERNSIKNNKILKKVK